jgi:hypothetical protein
LSEVDYVVATHESATLAAGDALRVTAGKARVSGG